MSVEVLHVMEDAQPTEAQLARIDAQRSRVRMLVTQSEPAIARELAACPDAKFSAEVRDALRAAQFIRQPHARWQS